MESTQKSSVAKAQEEWYNNSTDLSKPIQIDMSQQKPTHPPHVHNMILSPGDPDSSWARVFKCSKCDHGILTAK